MYLVDAMDGFQFEAFLVEIFQTIGYDVKETKKTADQGADLFVTRSREHQLHEKCETFEILARCMTLRKSRLLTRHTSARSE
ncbi:hypothetical protein A7K61_22715 [Pseudomonas sp. AP42]|nr:hypothetical protein A7K61_22715 [Pseudomonas sp. AP42]